MLTNQPAIPKSRPDPQVVTASDRWMERSRERLSDLMADLHGLVLDSAATAQQRQRFELAWSVLFDAAEDCIETGRDDQ